MPRPSNVDLLPADIRQQVNTWLNDRAVSQLDIVDRANALINAINQARPNEKPVALISKSSLNRYAQRVTAIGEKMRQSRQVSEMLIGQLGNQPAGEVGKLINESIRTIVFDAVTGLAEGDEPVSPDVVNKLALAAKRLEEATSINEKRERQIRDEERKAAAEDMAGKARELGVSEETIDTIWRDVLKMGND